MGKSILIALVAQFLFTSSSHAGAKAQEDKNFIWQCQHCLCSELPQKDNWICTSQDWTLGKRIIFVEKNRSPCYLAIKEEKALQPYHWKPSQGLYAGSTLDGTATEGRAFSTSGTFLQVTIVYWWDPYGQQKFDHIFLNENGRVFYLERGWGSDQPSKIGMCKTIHDVLKLILWR